MPRASGGKQMVINTRARAVSTDQNRQGAFTSEHIAEILRHFLDLSTSDANAGGTEALGSAQGNPLRGTILAGLRGRPEIGTVNLFVEPGVVCVVDPSFDISDDSTYKIVHSDGVTTAGALTLTAGAGSARIDMLECSILDPEQDGTVLETASRDIYDPTTGQFSAALVDKVTELQLSFRIRTGTAGGGFAGLGTAAGWLPLMVWVTPAAAADWDDVVYAWDVRPLYADFANAVKSGNVFPSGDAGRSYIQMIADPAGSPDDFRLLGFVESTLAGRVCGGEIGKVEFEAGVTDGAVATGAGGDIIEPGFAYVAEELTFLYIAYPFGLPRWARYFTFDFGSRVPGPFRGLLVHSNTPCDYDGQPTADLSMPTVYDLGGMVLAGQDEGRCVFVQLGTSTTEGSNTIMIDNVVRSIGPSNVQGSTPTSISSAWVGVYNLDTNIPRIATEMTVEIDRDFGAGATVNPSTTLSSFGLTNPYNGVFSWWNEQRTITAQDNGSWVGEFTFPLRMSAPKFTDPDPGAAGTEAWDFAWGHAAVPGPQTIADTNASIRGFRINF